VFGRRWWVFGYAGGAAGGVGVLWTVAAQSFPTANRTPHTDGRHPPN
jgi:hypothetical protein